MKDIKIGITGQTGFIGSHMYNFLGTVPNVSRIHFHKEYFKDSEKLRKFVSNCDVIIHLAALNRHENQNQIYDTNIGLVKKLIRAIDEAGVQPKLIFSSSTQEENQNSYGESKKDGRILFEKWAQKNDTSIVSLKIPNVFGPFGKPFHNSFIATFCHQIISGNTPEVQVDNKVHLIYINELVDFIFNEAISNEKGIKNINVPSTATYLVSEVLELLNNFNRNYLNKGEVPSVKLNSFELNLFNTFTSFIPKDYYPRKIKKHTDERGSFVEIIRAHTSGQTSFSTTVPGVTRGNHYHTRKIERFAVISGKASIKLRKIDSDEIYEYIIDGNEPAYVDMPIWHTHNITNIGKTELITVFWINESYDPTDADTFFIEV